MPEPASSLPSAGMRPAVPAGSKGDTNSNIRLYLSVLNVITTTKEMASAP